MRDVDWKIIATLHAERNITRAAELLFITQSTLTKRIQQLEKELGTVLIIRSNKGITFTPEGEYVAEYAEKILKLIEKVTEHIEQANQDDGKVLKIGVPNTYAQFVLPQLTKQFTAMHTGVRFEVTTELSHNILTMLENRELPVGFVRGDIKTSLRTHLVAEDQIYVVSKGPIHMDDLPHLPQIEYTKEPTIIKATERWWKERYTQPPLIRMCVDHGDACREMILNGLGYGIFSDLRFIGSNKELVSTPLFFMDGRRFTRKTWFVYHKEELKSKVVSDFVNFVKRFDFHSL